MPIKIARDLLKVKDSNGDFVNGIVLATDEGGAKLDEINIYIGDFSNKTTLNITKGLLNSLERVIVS